MKTIAIIYSALIFVSLQSVIAQSLTLDNPVGGEIYDASTSLISIEFTSSNLEYLRIEYQDRPDSSWTMIVDSIPLINGLTTSYGWGSLPNIASDSVRVAIVGIDEAVADTSGYFTMDRAVGLEDFLNVSASVTIFPNPSSEYVYIQSDLEDFHRLDYQIYSTDGKLMHAGELVDEKIQVESLPSGMYLLSIKEQSSRGRRAIVSLIKR